MGERRKLGFLQGGYTALVVVEWGEPEQYQRVFFRGARESHIPAPYLSLRDQRATKTDSGKGSWGLGEEMKNEALLWETLTGTNTATGLGVAGSPEGALGWGEDWKKMGGDWEGMLSAQQQWLGAG